MHQPDDFDLPRGDWIDALGARTLLGVGRSYFYEWAPMNLPTARDAWPLKPRERQKTVRFYELDDVMSHVRLRNDMKRTA